MRVLLTGANGQLGQALMVAKPQPIELIACGRAELDLASPQACSEAVRFYRPDWVLNAGAYTAVDKAESEPELALAVNVGAPAAFAEALAATGGRLLQVSTDFVFNGLQGSPYRPDQALDPLGVYGASKAAGEAAALQLSGSRVLRTSWVYGPVGQNFCRTMLRLHREREQLGVVADQVGCPTSTLSLAAACWRAIGVGADPSGPRILHWSDAGVASWYDFAVAIGELGMAAGLLERAARVLPLTTADYPTPAQRPSYSLLDCSTSRAALGLEPVHWRAALARVLDPG
ncbi:dTDP-4-dehydrorhamnose reductase [Synechococcus lacustris C3-12m-Tous]|uniref:dTDP-4-dehydrorhamnose reductase n=1 Tax=Synechococcus lacustris TaxID=2116544 RepID=UPI0020CDECC7|nr:dTDP-4-dehydrorhamnose reductase [Synechococcus lacustris]MCP9925925.1 dTDP-4-dehydrorhamnose reductase [Synechococcus lacustris C3-12m-Tous]